MRLFYVHIGIYRASSGILLYTPDVNKVEDLDDTIYKVSFSKFKSTIYFKGPKLSVPVHSSYAEILLCQFDVARVNSNFM